MEFKRPLLKLPVCFSAEALEQEVRALPKSSWVPHPGQIPGNDAVRLITPEGKPSDGLDGQMAPTPDLLACPYIIKIMAELGGTWGRSRLMGLAAGSQVPRHIDSHYYWRTHLRIHIPVITNPAVTFTCGSESVHMAPGECWVFDSFQPHMVENGGNEHRVHLVLDSAGGGQLWDLVEAASQETPPPPEMIAPGGGSIGDVAFEQVNSPKVMPPWEMDAHLSFVQARTKPHPQLDRIANRLDRLTFEWRGLWARYGDSDEGLPAFRTLIAAAATDVNKMAGTDIVLQSGVTLKEALGRMVFMVAVAAPRPALQMPSGGVVSRRLAS